MVNPINQKIEIWQKIQSFVVLVICVFAGFMLIAAPIEMNEVRKAQNYPIIKAIYLGSQTKPAVFSRGEYYVQYNFKNLENNQELAIIDLEAGDLPFKINILWFNIYDNKSKVQNELKIGHIYPIIMHPNGKKYFLKAGDYNIMSIILFLSICWFALLFIRAQSHKNVKPIQDCQN